MLLELEVSHMMEKNLLCLPGTWPKLNGIYLGASAKPDTTADCAGGLPSSPTKESSISSLLIQQLFRKLPNPCSSLASTAATRTSAAACSALAGRLGWLCLTIDSLPEELQEPTDRCHHLSLVQIQKGDNLEAQLLQKTTQLKHIRDGSHEVGMMLVAVVAH